MLLAATAYVLLQELRLTGGGTARARAQVATLRLELLKIDVQVIASARRLVLRLPAAFSAAWIQLTSRRTARISVCLTRIVRSWAAGVSGIEGPSSRRLIPPTNPFEGAVTRPPKPDT